MTTPSDTNTMTAPAPPAPLRTGEQMSRAEFERRYHAMPHLKKAELLEGVVYVPSPLHHTTHGRPHSQIQAWLTSYYVATPGLDISDNATVRLAPRSEVQPDVLLRIPAHAGGSSRITDDDYIEGAPELVVEIASSSTPYDLHTKRALYQQYGVAEYLLWQTEAQRITWWHRHADGYHPLPPDAEGIITSRVFPALRLDVAALLAGDVARVVARVQAGVGSAEHCTFIERLAG